MRRATEQFADALRVDVACVADRGQPVRRGAQRSQDVEPLPAGAASNEQAREAPEEPKKGGLNEVGSVHEVDPSCARLGLLKRGSRSFV